VGGQYERPRTLKDVLHLPAECTRQSNSCTDRKILERWFFHTSVPSVKEYFRKTGMPEDSKFRPLLDNCTAHSRGFELRSGNISVLNFPPNMTPLIQHMDQTKQEVLLSARFRSQACESRRSTKRLSTYTIKGEVFNIACARNSVKAKKYASSLEEIVASCNGW